jgi:hypothetical protein
MVNTVKFSQFQSEALAAGDVVVGLQSLVNTQFPAPLFNLTDGQIIIGSSIGPPLAENITAGMNIEIINGHNSIEISATGLAGFTNYHVTTTSAAMTSFGSYITDNASLVTLALPATSAYGDLIIVVGKGAGGWLISQGTSQQVFIGAIHSTAGTSGSIASTNNRDCIILMCTNPDLEWTGFGIQGNINYS